MADAAVGAAGMLGVGRTEVTAAGIARLAGVGRAAVSNWRRRHGDFPRPVGGTDGSPCFDLADVEQWLRVQGKLGSVPLRERVWQQLEQHPDGTAGALLRIGAVLLLLRERPYAWPELARTEQDDADRSPSAAVGPALASVLRERLGDGHPVPVSTVPELASRLPLLGAVAELAGELGSRQTFEFLMGRHHEIGMRQFPLTPAEPAELMAELAGPAALVLDPACGFGNLLRAAAPTAAVSGQEADPDLAALAALRLALHTDGPVRIRTGDSLRADAFPEHTSAATSAATTAAAGVDAVLCHPPYNERGWGHDELAYDTRW